MRHIHFACTVSAADVDFSVAHWTSDMSLTIQMTLQSLSLLLYAQLSTNVLEITLIPGLCNHESTVNRATALKMSGSSFELIAVKVLIFIWNRK
jgi:hypothetical protein